MSSKPGRVLAALIISCGFLIAGGTTDEAAATTPTAPQPQTVRPVLGGDALDTHSMPQYVVLTTETRKIVNGPAPTIRPVIKHYAPVPKHKSKPKVTVPTISLELRAYNIAKSKKGDPYVWGATGPHAFDCSGLVYYSFKQAGKSWGRMTAQGQYNASKHISASSRRIGDLIFFGGSYGIYHVGFYAGNGYMWDAPHTGSVVRLEKIWSSNVHYGRI